MGKNYLIKLNKIKYKRHGTKCPKGVMKSIANYDRKQRKKLQKKRLRKMELARDRILARRSLEDKMIMRKYRGEELTNINITRVPKSVFLKFQSWCANRGYTVKGKLRRFLVDCITGVVDE